MKRLVVVIVTLLASLALASPSYADPSFGPGAGNGEGNNEPHENPGTACHPPGQTSDLPQCG